MCYGNSGIKLAVVYVRDYKTARDLPRGEILYSILIAFDISMKVLMLIKMEPMVRSLCLQVNFSFDVFPVQNGFKHEDSVSPLLLILF